MNRSIVGKKCTIITKTGQRHDYTHITYLDIVNDSIGISGETDDVDGTRINVNDVHKVEGLHLMIFEFYKPRL